MNWVIFNIRKGSHERWGQLMNLAEIDLEHKVPIETALSANRMDSTGKYLIYTFQSHLKSQQGT
jgi:hypothetical protein